MLLENTVIKNMSLETELCLKRYTKTEEKRMVPSRQSDDPWFKPCLYEKSTLRVWNSTHLCYDFEVEPYEIKIPNFI